MAANSAMDCKEGPMAKLDVIFGSAEPEGSVVDPVCKMTVSKANPPGGTCEHEGETYYFCAPGCNEAFAADPERFLQA